MGESRNIIYVPDPRVLYETPLRVYAPLDGTTVQVCDYVFQDEAASDSAERFHDLLGLSLPESALEMDSERVPGR